MAVTDRARFVLPVAWATSVAIGLIFVFVKAPQSCKVRFDAPTDRDRDGLGTGLFANTPASNGPGGLVYLSDHTGVGADLSCRKG